MKWIAWKTIDFYSFMKMPLKSQKWRCPGRFTASNEHEWNFQTLLLLLKLLLFNLPLHTPPLMVTETIQAMHSFFLLHNLNCCCLVVQSCLTLCDPVNCNPPGSSRNHGILQARILDWVAISSSRGSSWPRDRTHISGVPWIAGRFFTTEPPGASFQTV